MSERIVKMKELVILLNKHRDNYYNKQKPTISDKEYDDLFDKLKELEKETGIVMSNSPTITVGYEVKSELKKVRHNHPMLSLDKTKSEEDLVRFLNNHDGLVMLKLDGLTVSLRYLDGKLVSAETRGNGEIGEDILHNAKVFTNIPLTIDYKDELIVDGEAIITYDEFEKINSKLSEDNKYKNPRNLVSGSVRQLDSKIAAKRNIKFIAWKAVKGISDNSFTNCLAILNGLGFDVVPFHSIPKDMISIDSVSMFNEILKKEAYNKKIPIDGTVVSYDDVKYGEYLGATGHHLKSQIAFKFYDEVYETTLKDIDWTLGKTGQITPTAIFEPVEIDGTIVSRASVHNISILTQLDLHVGDIIEVYKANAIIPQIKRNISSEERMALRKDLDYIVIPATCPICGGNTEIKQDNNSKVLMCTNHNCEGKLLGKLTHFVSKNAMDINGLSESTLEKFIELGWLTSFIDIYFLNVNRYEMMKLDGFGEKSVNKLLDAIEASKRTTLDRFIYALSIPLIGRSASKTISRYFNGDYDRFISETTNPYEWFNWSILADFGDAMHDEMWMYLKNNKDMIEELASYLTFEKLQIVQNSKSLNGFTFVITGLLNHFANRDEAKEKIESLGGKVSGSVSAKTSYLVNNDINSTSGKNKKAKELNVPIITEEELIEMLK